MEIQNVVKLFKKYGWEVKKNADFSRDLKKGNAEAHIILDKEFGYMIELRGYACGYVPLSTPYSEWGHMESREEHYQNEKWALEMAIQANEQFV